MKIISVFVLMLLLFNCKDKNEVDSSLTCNAIDPARDLPWLKAKIAEYEASSMGSFYAAYTIDYYGQTLITFITCCPACSSVRQYFDCSGEEVVIADKMARPVLKQLWKGKDFECNMM